MKKSRTQRDFFIHNKDGTFFVVYEVITICRGMDSPIFLQAAAFLFREGPDMTKLTISIAALCICYYTTKRWYIGSATTPYYYNFQAAAGDEIKFTLQKDKTKRSYTVSGKTVDTYKATAITNLALNYSNFK